MAVYRALGRRIQLLRPLEASGADKEGMRRSGRAAGGQTARERSLLRPVGLSDILNQTTDPQ